VIDDIAVTGHHDDASEVLEYVRVEDCHEVHDGTVEGVSVSTNEVGVDIGVNNLNVASGISLGKIELQTRCFIALVLHKTPHNRRNITPVKRRDSY
jgi:hypothetical protein